MVEGWWGIGRQDTVVCGLARYIGGVLWERHRCGTIVLQKMSSRWSGTSVLLIRRSSIRSWSFFSLLGDYYPYVYKESVVPTGELSNKKMSIL